MNEIPVEQLLDESEVLPREFYAHDAIRVAKSVLGKVLVHDHTAGIIVEAEAYLGGDDLASHSSRGLTERTRPIFGPPGHAYVYLIYGFYDCLNFVAEPEGHAGCVLIRALQPLCGFETMFRRRPTATKPEALASGPGKLTRAMGIDRKLNGADLVHGPLTVHRWRKQKKFEIVTTPRIGITKCADWPLRYYVQGNPFVSKK